MQPAGGDPDLTYTAAEARRLISVVSPFDGCLLSNPGAYNVTQRGAGANFSVDVAAGTAVVTGDDVAGQNSYVAWNDATFNLVTPGAPGSGTRLHRVVLQLRDKLNNGAWTTYDFIPVLVQDTGAGFPAEPNSSFTLAQVSIATGQANVSNANITDMRVGLGETRAWYTGTLSRTSTTRTTDPTLSLMLAGSATYRVTYGLFWTGTTGHLLYGWDRPSGASGHWGHFANIGGAPGANNYGYGWSEFESAVTPSSGANFGGVHGTGTVITTAGSPQPWAVSWGSSDGTAIVLQAGSIITAERIG